MIHSDLVNEYPGELYLRILLTQNGNVSGPMRPDPLFLLLSRVLIPGFVVLLLVVPESRLRALAFAFTMSSMSSLAIDPLILQLRLLSLVLRQQHLLLELPDPCVRQPLRLCLPLLLPLLGCRRGEVVPNLPLLKECSQHLCRII